MTAIEKTNKLLICEQYAFVLINRDKIHTSKLIGIKPVSDAVNQHSELTQGGVLTDKVIEKAAALLAVYGGIQNI